jgi:hypothetical protein
LKEERKVSAERSKTKEVRKVIRDVRASWWEDGLIEVMSGFIFLFMAAWFCMMEFVPDSTLKKGLEVGFYAVLILFAISSAWIKRYFKKKYVWPKTGYARPQIIRKSKIVFLFVFVLIILNIVLISLWQLYQNGASNVKLPAFFTTINSYREGFFVGSVVFLAYFSVYLSIKERRFLMTGILGFCSGIFAELILTTFDLNYSRMIAAIILGVIGFSSLFTGTPRFVRFRKEKVDKDER